MDAGMELSDRRLADLERRVLALEERARRALWSEPSPCMQKENELAQRYGEYVDKTVAAKVLGVTRATVYAMLRDGRIEGACSGKRVSTRSIARYLETPGRGRRRRQEPDNKQAAELPGMQKKEGQGNECA